MIERLDWRKASQTARLGFIRFMTGALSQRVLCVLVEIAQIFDKKPFLSNIKLLSEN